MGIAQIVMICVLCLNIGVALAMHGKPKEGKHSFFISLVSTAIWVWLLIAGGFFHG